MYSCRQSSLSPWRCLCRWGHPQDSADHPVLCERLMPTGQGGSALPVVLIPRAAPENVILTWSMTQCPSLEAFSRAVSATISCPCPKDTLWNFPESIVKPSLLPAGGHDTASRRVNQGGVRKVRHAVTWRPSVATAVTSWVTFLKNPN